ncbi:type III secretion protein W|uniref:Type III secretion protein W n=1 Tax=Brenneria salicis ATCC 15712 = DSM 30166 TaxID=714314 RepID=A0A366IB03_9GAMM|nr:type III secretion system gatekeeper subunit SctW [Brenneria salicis]NMN91782.1 type III secretion protein W [Brenneria salicis ATCC 15712 = DSM 30166]RBP65849.1 type III secretion protein W [Brenneria salicis ATCC 15712 = DSM 30166]RLM31880.1 SepL/TyeA/HrpJ family type III secretion system gatekeeper [Brenneria salicis ATCC 15712 = DSM 30166]
MIKISGAMPVNTSIPSPVTMDDGPAAPTAPQKTSPHHTPAAPALSTSMEEIAMAFGEQAERRSKSLSRRNISQPDVRAGANVERIEKLTELFRMLENSSQNTLDQQIGRMRSLLMQETPPDLNAILTAAGNDPARGDILLRHVHSQSAQHAPEVAAAAEQALQQLHTEKGPEVRAGLNTAAAISLFSTQPEQKQAMRELYYQKIVHQQSASSLLDALLERFDAASFSVGLRTMQRALAADIASLAPSISKPVLNKMLSNLHDAKHLSHTLSSSQAMLSRLATKLPEFTMGAVDLTRRLIGLSANGAYARDLHNLGREVAGSQLQHQSLFFNALLPLVNELPQPLWRDAKNRQTALQLIRGLIGELALYEKHQAAQSQGKGTA